MIIIKITLLNFLGLSAWKSDKLGKLNIITGDNGVGKSTILKAIKACFKSSGIDPDLIKTGEKKAEIFINLDNGIIIERKITNSQNLPKVIVGGEAISSPQAFLNKLIGPYNFDPTEFCIAEKPKRRKLLLQAIPFCISEDILKKHLSDYVDVIDLNRLDYGEHGLLLMERIASDVYNMRHEKGIDLTRLQKAIEQDKRDIPATLDAKKFKDFDLNEKIEKLNEGTAIITQHEAEEEAITELRERAGAAQGRIEEVETELVHAKNELAEIQTKGKKMRQKMKDYQRPEIDSLKAEIDEYQQYQKLIIKLEDIERKGKLLEEETETREILNNLYTIVSKELPRKLLSELKLPVDNIEFKGDSIYVDGKALEKLATSELILFSINMAKALASELKVICIDRFESLGQKAREIFEKATAGDGFEYFITSVTPGELNIESTDTFEPGKSKKTGVLPKRRTKGDAGF